MATTIKIKTGTTTTTPTLVSGELAFNTALGKLMIGDGTSTHQMAKAGQGNNYQTPIIDVQVDATLNPGASPVKGDRYLITASGSLHANFGVISGIGNNDIVEYTGTAFVVDLDASVIGEGILVYTKNLFGNKQFLYYNGTSWGSVVTLQEAYDGGGATINTDDGGGGLDINNATDTLLEDGVLNVANSGTGDTGEAVVRFSNSNNSFGKPVLSLSQSDNAGSGAHINISELSQNPTTVADGDVWRTGAVLRFSPDGVGANNQDVVATQSSSVASGDLLRHDGSNWLSTTSLTGSYTLSGANTLSGSLTTSGGGDITVTGAGSVLAVASSGSVTFASGTSLVAAAGSTITVPTPILDTDAANKSYVDSVAAGLDPKASVVVATTADVGGTYAIGASPAGTDQITGVNLTTIDGITTLAVNDRILVKSQTDTTQNGIYYWRTGAIGTATITRATDSDNLSPSTEVSGGNFTFVEQGTTNADTGWVISLPNTVAVLNTDSIVWVQFSASGTITGSNGITKVVNDIQLDLTSLTAATIATGDSLPFIDVSDSNNEKKTTVALFLSDLDIPNGISADGLITRTAADTYASRTITGTASRLSVTNGGGVAGNPTLDIDAAYVGQTSITTLGTVTTGTWSASTVAANRGGTGFSSYAVGDLLYADTTSTLAKLADIAAGAYLRSGGVTTAPLWSTLTLPNTATQGSILVANTVNTVTALDGSTAADNSATVTALVSYRSGTDDLVYTTALDGGVF